MMTSANRVSTLKRTCLLVRIFTYCSAALLVMLCGTLYREAGNNGLFELCFFCFTVILLLLLCVTRCVSYKYLTGQMTWLVFVGLSYITVASLTHTFGSMVYMLRFVLLGFAPLLIYLLREADALRAYLRAFANVMVFLGATSIVLWVIGPLMHIIAPNCAIENTWNGTQTLVISPGYWGLLFETQTISIADVEFTRNTSIFVEAPSFAFPLFLAIAYELLLQKTPRKCIVIILFVALLTSTSTIGIALSAAALVYYRYKRNASKKPGPFGLNAIFVVGVTVTFVVVFGLVIYRLGTDSGVARVDDHLAGFSAWIVSPAWGYGFDQDVIRDAIIPYFSLYRLDNLGIANSITDLAVTGGVVLLGLFAVAFLMQGLCVRSNERFFVLLLFLMFCLSDVWGTWAFIFSLSMGIERAFAIQTVGPIYRNSKANVVVPENGYTIF